MKSLMRLFKAVEINKIKGTKAASQSILAKTLKHGFIFSPEVVYNYTETELVDLVEWIHVGLTPEQLNSSFHKSWQKIKDASMLQLVMEQLIHYFTTYGFASLGIYNEESVYIPNEKLEIPETDIDGINIVVIHGYAKEEIKEKVIDLLKTGIALHEDTIKDIVDLSKHVGIGQENINDIKNKEVKTALCDHLKIFPEDPVEFLRYIIYKATGRTLLIKDMATIEGIKESDDLGVVTTLFKKYQDKYGLQRLAAIFYRFKPIFLALKTQISLGPTINKIRKLANKYHKPMKIDYLNNITAIIKGGFEIDSQLLQIHLKKVSTFRKIRLLYALQYRLHCNAMGGKR